MSDVPTRIYYGSDVRDCVLAGLPWERVRQISVKSGLENELEEVHADFLRYMEEYHGQALLPKELFTIDA